MAITDILSPATEPKKKIINPDGSFSTERTISISGDGKHFLIPTIIEGKQYTEDEAIQMFRDGTNKPVAISDTLEGLNEYAVERSASKGLNLKEGGVMDLLGKPKTEEPDMPAWARADIQEASLPDWAQADLAEPDLDAEFEALKASPLDDRHAKLATGFFRAVDRDGYDVKPEGEFYVVPTEEAKRTGAHLKYQPEASLSDIPGAVIETAKSLVKGLYKLGPGQIPRAIDAYEKEGLAGVAKVPFQNIAGVAEGFAQNIEDYKDVAGNLISRPIAKALQDKELRPGLQYQFDVQDAIERQRMAEGKSVIGETLRAAGAPEDVAATVDKNIDQDIALFNSLWADPAFVATGGLSALSKASKAEQAVRAAKRMKLITEGMKTMSLMDATRAADAALMKNTSIWKRPVSELPGIKPVVEAAQSIEPLNRLASIAARAIDNPAATVLQGAGKGLQTAGKGIQRASDWVLGPGVGPAVTRAAIASPALASGPIIGGTAMLNAVILGGLPKVQGAIKLGQKMTTLGDLIETAGRAVKMGGDAKAIRTAGTLAGEAATREAAAIAAGVPIETSIKGIGQRLKSPFLRSVTSATKNLVDPAIKGGVVGGVFSAAAGQDAEEGIGPGIVFGLVGHGFGSFGKLFNPKQRDPQAAAAFAKYKLDSLKPEERAAWKKQDPRAIDFFGDVDFLVKSANDSIKTADGKPAIDIQYAGTPEEVRAAYLAGDGKVWLERKAKLEQVINDPSVTPEVQAQAQAELAAVNDTIEKSSRASGWVVRDEGTGKVKMVVNASRNLNIGQISHEGLGHVVDQIDNVLGDESPLKDAREALVASLIGVDETNAAGQTVRIPGAYEEADLNNLAEGYFARLGLKPKYDEVIVNEETGETKLVLSEESRQDILKELIAEHTNVFTKNAMAGNKDVVQHALDVVNASDAELAQMLAESEANGGNTSELFQGQTIKNTPELERAAAERLLSFVQATSAADANLRTVGDYVGVPETVPITKRQIINDAKQATEAYASAQTHADAVAARQAVDVLAESNVYATAAKPRSIAKAEAEKEFTLQNNRKPTSAELNNLTDQILDESPRVLLGKNKTVFKAGDTPVLLTPRQQEMAQVDMTKTIKAALAGVLTDDPNGMVLQTTADGKEIFNGKYFTPAQMKAIRGVPNALLPKSIKENIAKINDVLTKKPGSLVEFVYHQAIKRGGNIPRTFRSVVPFSFGVTKADNTIVRTWDATAIFRDLQKEAAKRQSSILENFRNVDETDYSQAMERFVSDMQKFGQNHAEGKSGRTNLDANPEKAKAKAEAIAQFLGFGKDSKVDLDSDKGKVKNYIRAFRMDRMFELKESLADPLPLNYFEVKRGNYMPDLEANEDIALPQQKYGDRTSGLSADGVSTQDAVSTAIKLVGPDELQRMADRYVKDRNLESSPEFMAMAVESSAREVIAKERYRRLAQYMLEMSEPLPEPLKADSRTKDLLYNGQQDYGDGPLHFFTDPENNGTFTVLGEPTPDAVAAKMQDHKERFGKYMQEMDARYLELAKDPEGNKAELQRMVDEAAKAAGYNIGPVFHGSKSKKPFTAFDRSKIERPYMGDGFHFANSRGHAEYYVPDEGGQIIAAYLKIENPMSEKKYMELIEASGSPFSINFGNHDGVIYYDDYNPKKQTIEDAKTYVPLSSKQIKSADPITRDAEGNIIPLSQRFNPESNDIRYMPEVDDSAYLELARDPEGNKAELQAMVDEQLSKINTQRPGMEGFLLARPQTTLTAKEAEQFDTAWDAVQSAWLDGDLLADEPDFATAKGQLDDLKYRLDDLALDLAAEEFGEPAQLAAFKRIQNSLLKKLESYLESGDPVLFDESGKVIPLSQRFNIELNDFRYMPEIKDIPGHAAEIEKALKGIFPFAEVRSLRGKTVILAGEKKNEGKIQTIPGGEGSGVAVSIFKGDDGKPALKVEEMNSATPKSGMGTKVLKALGSTGLPIYHSTDLSQGFWRHIKKTNPELLNRPELRGKVAEAKFVPKQTEKGWQIIDVETGKPSGIDWGVYPSKAEAEISADSYNYGYHTARGNVYMPEVAEAPQSRQELFKEDMKGQIAFFRQKAAEAGLESMDEVTEAQLSAWSSEWREKNPRTDEAGNLRFMPAMEEDGNPNPGFYSGLGKLVADQKQERFSPDQIKAIITGKAKAEEVKWTGILPAIDRIAEENNGKVSKQDVLEHLKNEGAVRFVEVTLGGRPEYSESAIQERLAELREFEPQAQREDVINMIEEEGTGPIPDAPKYSQWQLPGGENYKEVVLAMPEPESAKNSDEAKYNTLIRKIGNGDFGWSGPEYNRALAERDAIQQRITGPNRGRIGALEVPNVYTSSHFPNIPNYVVHMRTNERSASVDGFTVKNTKSGNKGPFFSTRAEAEAYQSKLPATIRTEIVPTTKESPGLFIEELQSDRHQQGRERGYKEDSVVTRKFLENHWRENESLQIIPMEQYVRATLETTGDTERVSDAPHRKDWPLALFKRALRDAVASGKEWVGWTDGETQADRYDLSKQVDSIEAFKDEGKAEVALKMIKDGRVVGTTTVPESQLADTVGKDLAQKIIDQKGDHKYEGVDLKVGGEGMKGFYDSILPKEIGKYVKQWGGKVEKGTIESTGTIKDGLAGELGYELVDPSGKVILSGESKAELEDTAATEYGEGYSVRPIGKGSTPIWKVSITPEMKEGVSKGQALFMPEVEESAASRFREEFKKTKLLTADQAAQILGDKVPTYLDDVVKFMAEQREKAVEGKFTMRDLVKAYLLTLGSIGSDAITTDVFTKKTGLKVPAEFTVTENGKTKIRPEEAVALWMGTEDGKAALDAVESGSIDPVDFLPLLKVRDAFGRNDIRNNAMRENSKQVNMLTPDKLADVLSQINEARGDTEKISSSLSELSGISRGKIGFIKHLLGFGDTATIDAVEINFWLTGKGDVSQETGTKADMVRRIKNQTKTPPIVADRISRKLKALSERYGLDKTVGEHVIHHWLWDKAKGTETKHTGMMEAQARYMPEVAEARQERNIRVAGDWLHRYFWGGKKPVKSMPRTEVEEYLNQFVPEKPVELYRFERVDYQQDQRDTPKKVNVQSWSRNKDMVEGIVEMNNEDSSEPKLRVRKQVFQPEEIYTDTTLYPKELQKAIEDAGGSSEMDEVLVRVNFMPELPEWAKADIEGATTPKSISQIPSIGSVIAAQNAGEDLSNVQAYR